MTRTKSLNWQKHNNVVRASILNKKGKNEKDP